VDLKHLFTVGFQYSASVRRTKITLRLVGFVLCAISSDYDRSVRRHDFEKPDLTLFHGLKRNIIFGRCSGLCRCGWLGFGSVSLWRFALVNVRSLEVAVEIVL